MPVYVHKCLTTRGKSSQVQYQKGTKLPIEGIRTTTYPAWYKLEHAAVWSSDYLAEGTAVKQVLHESQPHSGRTGRSTLVLTRQAIGELRAWEYTHADQSGLRKCATFLNPLFRGLERCGSAVDVFSNAEPTGILSLLWGSVRLILVVSQPCKDFKVAWLCG